MRQITPENLRESSRLRALWDEARTALKAQGIGSQAAFGKAFDIGNQAAVGFFLNGHLALSPKAAAGFARGLGVPISAFSPRLAAMLTGAKTGQVMAVSDAEAKLLMAYRSLPAAQKRQALAIIAGLSQPSSEPSQPSRPARKPSASPRAIARQG